MMLVFLFPGQNSRYPGMIGKFAALHPANADLLELASQTLHRDLAAHFRAENQDQFSRNRDVQVGVFLASHLLLCSLEREGIVADWSLGLSLGEYNHLVHIGALRFECALRLLDARGNAYDTSPHGAMASISPVTLEQLEAVARETGVAVALHNTPRQNVLSGARENLDAAIEVLEDRYFAASTLIDQRLPMHSPLFAGVAESFRPALEAAPWRRPQRPYLPNAGGTFLTAPGARDFVELLTRHVRNPVLWRESMELIARAVAHPVFVEVGPRAVLSGMLGRRWLDYPHYRTDSEQDFPANFAALVKEMKTLGLRRIAETSPGWQTQPALATGPVHAAR